MSILHIFLAVVGISILVIVHETGHYLAARAFKMRVLRYSIGFGPTLFKYRPKGSPTTFQVAAIPFLAYVQIAGMNPYEEVDPDDPEIFSNQSLIGRIVTIAAGPFANYLAACIMAFVIGMVGWPSHYASLVETPVSVGTVQEDSAAAQAGLKTGDKIVAVNGVTSPTFLDIMTETRPRAGKPTDYVVERDGKRETLSITPKEKVIEFKDDEGNVKETETVGLIGVTQKRSKPYPIAKAATTAIMYPWELTALQLKGMGDMVKKRTTKGLHGPVEMGKMVGAAAERGATDFFAMLVLLSVALGLFNLLPFPALDGGRLFFLGYEAITRRKPNEKFEAMVHTVGILFLLGVLVLVTFRDILS